MAKPYHVPLTASEKFTIYLTEVKLINYIHVCYVNDTE